MNRVFPAAALALAFVVLPACNNTPDSSCVKTGCSAGSTCNASSGKCDQVMGTGGGGGSSTGGGTSTGGGAATGGGGGAFDGGEDGGSTGDGGSSDAGFDAGIDAGPVIVDPFDDGGVFAPGDICSFPLNVNFTAQTSATVSVDMSTFGNEYLPSCNQSTSGSDAIFKVVLAANASLTVTATNTATGMQDAVLSLLSSPCATFAEVACSDDNTVDAAEVLTVPSLPAGTWYVLLDTHGQPPGTFDVSFDLGTPTVGPDNDTCATSQVLTFVNDTVTVSGTTVGAFNDNAGAAPSCAPNSVSPDVFYSFTLTQPQDVHVTVVADDAVSAMVPAIELLDGCAGTALKCSVGTTIDAVGEFTAHNLQAGTYVLVVDGTSSIAGDFALDLELGPPVIVPPNDTCAMPATLVPNVSQMIDTSAADIDVFPSCAYGEGGEVIYSFTITQPQSVTVTLTPTDGLSDGVLSLRTDCTDDESELSCTDNTYEDEAEVITLPSLQPGTYFVTAASYYAGEGAFGISLELGAPVPAPMNDTCATAAPLVTGMSQSVNLSAAARDITPGCSSFSQGGDAVYTFTTTQPQRATIVVSSNDPDSDAVVTLRTACSDATSELSCRNRTYTGDDETIDRANLPAGTYFITVSSYDALKGDFGVSLTLAPPVAPPANDTCATAATLVPNASQQVDLFSATADVSTTCGAAGQPDVFYTFTLTTSQHVVLNALGPDSGTAKLELLSTACATGSTSVSCATSSSGLSRVIADLGPGQYWVNLAESVDGETSMYGLELSTSAQGVLANESCAAPTPVTFVAGSATLVGDLTKAVVDLDYTLETACTLATGADLTYAVIIPPGQTLTVTATPIHAADIMLRVRAPTCTDAPALSCRDTLGTSASPEILTTENTTAAPMAVTVILQSYGTSVLARDEVTMLFEVQ